MLHFEPNNLTYKLVDLLSITGEFPTSSLYLVGKERVVKSRVKKLTESNEIRSSFAEIETKLLLLSGKGAMKSIKLYKGAIPILKWIGADEYYKWAFRGYNFPGDVKHKERNFRIAEVAAMCMGAGIEFRPYKLPQLKSEQNWGALSNYPVFYSSKVLKLVDEEGMKRVMFSRVIGLMYLGNVGYAVYNTRNAPIKWYGNGEGKAKWFATQIVRANSKTKAFNYDYDNSDVTSAILFGKTDGVALETLNLSHRKRRFDLRFDDNYQHIYFIPLNELGKRQLKIFTVQNWKEKILDALFEPETRSYDRGMFEYDAFIEGKYIYSFLDGDLARLKRLKLVLDDGDKKIEVVCYPHQLTLLRCCLGTAVTFKILKLSATEEVLGIK